MIDHRRNMLLVNLAEARKLISVMQSKIDRQRDDISRKDLRISHLVADKREMATKLNEQRDTQND